MSASPSTSLISLRNHNTRASIFHRKLDCGDGTGVFWLPPIDLPHTPQSTINIVPRATEDPAPLLLKPSPPPRPPSVNPPLPYSHRVLFTLGIVAGILSLVALVVASVAMSRAVVMSSGTIATVDVPTSPFINQLSLVNNTWVLDETTDLVSPSLTRNSRDIETLRESVGNLQGSLASLVLPPDLTARVNQLRNDVDGFPGIVSSAIAPLQANLTLLEGRFNVFQADVTAQLAEIRALIPPHPWRAVVSTSSSFGIVQSDLAGGGGARSGNVVVYWAAIGTNFVPCMSVSPTVPRTCFAPPLADRTVPMASTPAFALGRQALFCADGFCAWTIEHGVKAFSMMMNATTGEVITGAATLCCSGTTKHMALVPIGKRGALLTYYDTSLKTRFIDFAGVAAIGDTAVVEMTGSPTPNHRGQAGVMLAEPSAYYDQMIDTYVIVRDSAHAINSGTSTGAFGYKLNAIFRPFPAGTVTQNSTIWSAANGVTPFGETYNCTSTPPYLCTGKTSIFVVDVGKILPDTERGYSTPVGEEGDYYFVRRTSDTTDHVMRYSDLSIVATFAADKNIMLLGHDKGSNIVFYATVDDPETRTLGGIATDDGSVVPVGVVSTGYDIYTGVHVSITGDCISWFTPPAYSKPVCIQRTNPTILPGPDLKGVADLATLTTTTTGVMTCVSPRFILIYSVADSSLFRLMFDNCARRTTCNQAAEATGVTIQYYCSLM